MVTAAPDAAHNAPARPAPGPSSGQGMLDVAHVAGAAAVVGLSARAPLHLLVPRPRGLAVWAYVATFGGGLVAGDTIDLSVRVGPGARALLSTQASTKVYRSEGPPARQELSARVGDGALLVVLPDPLCPFGGSIYEQAQRFELAPSASLLFVDWLSSGRSARRERWAMSRYRSLTEIHRGGSLLARDALHLEDGPSGTIADRFGRFDSIAFAALLGPALEGLVRKLVADHGERPAHSPHELPLPRGERKDLLASVSPVAGGAVLRVAGESTALVGDFLRNALETLPALLEDDPWSRRA